MQGLMGCVLFAAREGSGSDRGERGLLEHARRGVDHDRFNTRPQEEPNTQRETGQHPRARTHTHTTHPHQFSPNTARKNTQTQKQG